ncbi:MAG: hypothetical protein WC876_10995 [Candidatus Thermoplasmatota archaeon]|jgi:hypothetical protein
MDSYVVVRLPSHGTLIGDAVARHPGSAVTCIGSGRHEHDGRSIADHVALVEGLPDAEISTLLLSWKRVHGEAPQVLGGPFALRLPVALDGDHTPTVALCLRLGEVLPNMAQRLQGGVLELWGCCANPTDAEEKRVGVQRILAGLPVLSVEVTAPSPQNLECWDLLRMAANEVVLDCQVPVPA